MSPSPVVIAITLAEPGGATSFALALAKYLHEDGTPVLVLAGEQGAWLEERCLKASIPFERIPHLRRAVHPWHDVLALWHFFKKLRDLKPRALHLNSSKAGVIGSLAGRFASVPRIVYCIAGWAALDTSSSFSEYLYLWAEKLTAWAKDVIVCLHPEDIAFAKQHHIRPKQLVMIPNGIDAPALQANLFSREDARRLLDLPQDSLVIGTIANFYPAKNLVFLIQVFAELKKQLPEAHLCIVGDGPERVSIECVVQETGLTSFIHLVGRKEEAARYLRAFDIFVLASKKEGMPLVLLEAAAAGLPIVATDVGAHAWMLPEATIVSPHDQDALVRALQEALLQKQAPSYTTTLARFTEEACLSAHTSLLL